MRGENSPSETLFGGGVSYDGGRIYATNGAGDAAALDAATGNQLWMVKPGGPLRGAPTDRQRHRLRASARTASSTRSTPPNGETRWTGAGSFELAGVFGSAAPAFAQSTLVAGYSSGELTAYRYENGQVVWQDALARTGISTVVGTLSDIDADPVIDNGRVFAIGQGGRMVAVELITGQRAWEIEHRRHLDALGGGRLGVRGHRPGAIARGRARLGPDPLDFAAPRLSPTGTARRARPQDRRSQGPAGPGSDLLARPGARRQPAGADQLDRPDRRSSRRSTARSCTTVEHRTPISLPPVVANNTLYVLDDQGRLTAWR